jgi:hypothetical protein
MSLVFHPVIPGPERSEGARCFETRTSCAPQHEDLVLRSERSERLEGRRTQVGYCRLGHLI